VELPNESKNEFAFAGNQKRDTTWRSAEKPNVSMIRSAGVLNPR
jgi:hypothetical protein